MTANVMPCGFRTAEGACELLAGHGGPHLVGSLTFTPLGPGPAASMGAGRLPAGLREGMAAAADLAAMHPAGVPPQLTLELVTAGALLALLDRLDAFVTAAAETLGGMGSGGLLGMLTGLGRRKV